MFSSDILSLKKRLNAIELDIILQDHSCLLDIYNGVCIEDACEAMMINEQQRERIHELRKTLNN